MGRRSHVIERRQQIVNGLLDVIAKRGYERATIASIAEASRLAPGLVHYYFKTKEEVLLELVRHLSTAIDSRFMSKLDQAGSDPERRLAAFLDAHLERGRDADPRAQAAWVVIAAESLRNSPLARLYQEASRARLEWLERL